MGTSYTFTIASTVRADPARVWAHGSDFAGVNRELWPLAHMTYPAGKGRLSPEATPPGRTAFRSWILLFGLVPVDFDDFTLVELEPGRAFSEVSRLFSMREWRHRRTILPTPEGSVVRDEVSCVPRWRWAGPVLFAVYRLAFVLRHRRLRRLFGASTGPVKVAT
jgi:ligand-binding SRPBCC domain-containing protein